MAKQEISGYELSRNWFDWCFENPDLISPTHTAMYFFIIEHCNRLGWKEKFGLPMEMTKDAIGIKNYRTYSNTLTDLIDWGFIKLIQKSKNQYSSCIIAIVLNTKAHTKALDKALQKHSQKQYIDTVCIDKQELLTIEPINKEQDINDIYKSYPTTCPIRKVSNGKCEANKEKIGKLLETRSKDELLLAISKYVNDCKTGNVYMKNFKTFLNNIPDIDEIETNQAIGKYDFDTMFPKENLSENTKANLTKRFDDYEAKTGKPLSGMNVRIDFILDLPTDELIRQIDATNPRIFY